MSPFRKKKGGARIKKEAVEWDFIVRSSIFTQLEAVFHGGQDTSIGIAALLSMELNMQSGF